MATEQRRTSREDLIERLQKVAAKLGKRTVSRAEFQRETAISEWQISKQQTLEKTRGRLREAELRLQAAGERARLS